MIAFISIKIKDNIISNKLSYPNIYRNSSNKNDIKICYFNINCGWIKNKKFSHL